MERLAREKIAAQQRLAGLRKEVCSIPGYTSDAGSLDLGSVLPVLQHSHSQHVVDRGDSPLTLANVTAHNLREENHFTVASSGAAAAAAAAAGARDDQDTNSTSTASEGGALSDVEEPSSFQVIISTR